MKELTCTYGNALGSVTAAVDKVMAADSGRSVDFEAVHELEDTIAKTVIGYVAKYGDPASKMLAEQMMRIYANEDRIRWYA